MTTLLEKINLGLATVVEVTSPTAPLPIPVPETGRIITIDVTKYKEDDGKPYTEKVPLREDDLKRELVMRRKQVAELEGLLALFPGEEEEGGEPI